MKKEIPSPYSGDNCFFCGSKNPEGLQLKFYLDEQTEEVSAEYLPAPPYIGQGNILHGGIQMGLLDEIMGWTSYVCAGEMAVTSDFQVTFSKPVYLGRQVKVTCRVTSRKDREIHMRSQLVDSDGNVCSVATGIYRILSKSRYESLIHGG